MSDEDVGSETIIHVVPDVSDNRKEKGIVSQEKIPGVDIAETRFEESVSRRQIICTTKKDSKTLSTCVQ